MKKNITINLCGRLYQIDEDAYELLSHYTDTLRNYFRKQEGGEEIANDIEERIAELLDDLKSQGIQAITIEHVQDIIQRIGQVDEIAGDGTSDAPNGEGSQAGGNSSSAAGGGEEPLNGKKFYRDSQNKMLAGVLAGCSHYFGGSVNAWRWGYVAVCVLWCIIHGGIPFSTGPFFGFALTFLAMPVLFLPVVPYILAAVFAPETQTPEDVLRMKGKKVNPQTLTEEVRESNAAKGNDDGKQIWNIFVGILTIGISICLTIGFIVAFCFFVAWLAAPELMADAWWDVDEKEILEKLIQPVTFCGLLLLTSIAILLYCSIHAAVSSFGKTPSMSTKQRIVWFLLWVASLAGFIGSCVYAANQYNKAYYALREKQGAERLAQEKRRTDALGHVFNETDWEFFQQGNWELIEATHTDRYTYSGQWMTGDEDVRYLDAYNDVEPIRYKVRKMEEVEPGVYRLSAAVRASNVGKFIFLQGQAIDPESNDTTAFVNETREIPHNGNEGGNIHEVLALERGNVFIPADPKTLNDSVLKELVLYRIPAQDRESILEANDGLGYGWNYVYIDSIRVEKPSQLFYGVTTHLKGKNTTTGWFSATDFKLEKIGDIPSNN